MRSLQQLSGSSGINDAFDYFLDESHQLFIEILIAFNFTETNESEKTTYDTSVASKEI